MTEVGISELQTDLTDKFSDLRSLCCQPGLFISEHFFDLRNSIDYDAERALSNQDEKSAPVNPIRLEWIDFLLHIEQTLMSSLQTESRPDPNQVFPSIKQRIDQFHISTGQEMPDLKAKKVEYAKIVVDIIDETIKLEKKLLGNQAIFYHPSQSELNLGALFYMPAAYLGTREMNHLK